MLPHKRISTAHQGPDYLEKVLKFQQQHYRTGELFTENIKYGCSNDTGVTCDFCARHEWTGPPAQCIPQLQQDIENPCHYLHGFETPLVDHEGEIRAVDGWQPRVVISSLFCEHPEARINGETKACYETSFWPSRR